MTNGWKSVGWMVAFMGWNFIISLLTDIASSETPKKEKYIFLSVCWLAVWFAWQIGELRREIREAKTTLPGDGKNGP